MSGLRRLVKILFKHPLKNLQFDLVVVKLQVKHNCVDTHKYYTTVHINQVSNYVTHRTSNYVSS